MLFHTRRWYARAYLDTWMARTPVAHTSLSHDGSPSVGNRWGSGLPSSRTDRAGAGETEHSHPSSRSGFDRSWELAAEPAAEPRGRSADELFQEARDRELVIRSGVQPLVGCQVGGPSSAKRQTSWSAAKRQKLSHRLQTPAKDSPETPADNPDKPPRKPNRRPNPKNDA